MKISIVEGLGRLPLMQLVQSLQTLSSSIGDTVECQIGPPEDGSVILITPPTSPERCRRSTNSTSSEKLESPPLTLRLQLTTYGDGSTMATVFSADKMKEHAVLELPSLRASGGMARSRSQTFTLDGSTKPTSSGSTSLPLCECIARWGKVKHSEDCHLASST